MSILCLLSLLVLWQAEASATRRMLHEPLFPNPPASSPKPTQKGFFFPPYHYRHNSPPPPTPTPPTTFPANISSLLFPQPSSSPHSLSHHAVAIVVSLSLLSSALLLLLLLALLYFRTHHPSPDPPDLPSSASDTLPLYPPNTLPSAPLSLGSSPELKPLPPLPPHPNTAQHHHHDHDDDEDQFFSPRLSPVRAALRFHTPSPPVSQQRNNSDNISLPTKKPPSPPPLPPPRPNLKPLHWDQLRPSSDLTMVWDHLKPASFQLNEDMTETLFMVNHTSDFPFRDHARRHIVASPTLEYRVLDPKKSHNIAILLRALNVTVDEVCEALEEGDNPFLSHMFTYALPLAFSSALQ